MIEGNREGTGAPAARMATVAGGRCSASLDELLYPRDVSLWRTADLENEGGPAEDSAAHRLDSLSGEVLRR